LISASGDRDHTISPSASSAFVNCANTSIASRTTFVTIAKRPSVKARDAGKGATDLPDGASDISARPGLNAAIRIEAAREISFSAR
jgi:hypothetical protein